jgi:hypothetical protein
VVRVVVRELELARGQGQVPGQELERVAVLALAPEQVPVVVVPVPEQALALVPGQVLHNRRSVPKPAIPLSRLTILSCSSILPPPFSDSSSICSKMSLNESHHLLCTIIG